VPRNVNPFHVERNTPNTSNFQEQFIEEFVFEYTWTNGDTKLKHMEYPTIETWFVEHLVDQYSESELEDAYTGSGASEPNGIDGVKRRVFVSAFTDIVDTVGDSASATDWRSAFNDVTANWPHMARAKLASHFYQHHPPDNSEFTDDLKRFAESEGVLEMTLEQVELSAYEYGNPFQNDELSHEEAVTLVFARSVGDDVPDDLPFDAIEDHDSYRDWLRETGDPIQAVNSHQFDADAPSGVIGHAAPPNEWGDVETNPIRSETCASCNDTLYHVVHSDAGETWADESGAACGAALLNSSDDYYVVSSHEGEIICDECEQSFGPGIRVGVIGNENGATMMFDNGIAKIIGGNWPNGDDSTLTLLSAASRDSVQREHGYVRLSLSSNGNVTRNSHERFVTDLVDNPRAVETDTDYPMIVVSDTSGLGTDFRAYYHREDVAAARYVKSGVEEAEDASESGLEEMFA